MKKYWEKGEEFATEVGNIRDDYIATSDTLYQYIVDWEDNNNKVIKLLSKSKSIQKKEKQAIAHLKSSTSDWRTIFRKTSLQNMELNYYITINDFVKFIDHFQIGIVIFKDYRYPKEHCKDGKQLFI